jgi:hypothetical protein
MYYYYIANKYMIAREIDKMATQSTFAPNYSTSGGYTPGQVESTGGGYNPNQPILAVGSGGYDPNNPSAYYETSNAVGGQVALTPNYNQPSLLAAAYDSRGGFVQGTYDDDPANGKGGYNPTISDPATSRLAGIPVGASSGDDTPAEPVVKFAGSLEDSDWRVRISLGTNASIFYKDSNTTNSKENSILGPLIDTNGVIFPYTPSITVNHTATYNSASITHANYLPQFYSHSDVSEISITGDFTVQNIAEGKYLMAAVYFFRAATKMFFGQGKNIGNPPPIVFLNGYGSHYFPHVPCVITSFQHQLTADVDYVEIPISTSELVEVDFTPEKANTGSVNLIDNGAGQMVSVDTVTPSILRSGKTVEPGSKQVRSEFKTTTATTRVPTNSSITVTLKPVYSRLGLHNRFNLDKFAAGMLLKDPITGAGGYL